jgi:hypothetical protein
LKWAEFSVKELLQADGSDLNSNVKKSHFTSLLEIIDFYNARSANKIPQPEQSRLNECNLFLK